MLEACPNPYLKAEIRIENALIGLGLDLMLRFRITFTQNSWFESESGCFPKSNIQVNSGFQNSQSSIISPIFIFFWHLLLIIVSGKHCLLCCINLSKIYLCFLKVFVMQSLQRFWVLEDQGLETQEASHEKYQEILNLLKS